MCARECKEKRIIKVGNKERVTKLYHISWLSARKILSIESFRPEESPLATYSLSKSPTLGLTSPIPPGTSTHSYFELDVPQK